MSADNLKNTSQTNWEALELMPDEDIDYSDIPPLTEFFFAEATLQIPDLSNFLVPSSIFPALFSALFTIVIRDLWDFNKNKKKYARISCYYIHQNIGYLKNLQILVSRFEQLLPGDAGVESLFSQCNNLIELLHKGHFTEELIQASKFLQVDHGNSLILYLCALESIATNIKTYMNRPQPSSVDGSNVSTVYKNNKEWVDMLFPSLSEIICHSYEQLLHLDKSFFEKFYGKDDDGMVRTHLFGGEKFYGNDNQVKITYPAIISIENCRKKIDNNYSRLYRYLESKK